MRPLRQTEPELRRAIQVLNRRDLTAGDQALFYGRGAEAHRLLLRLAADEEVADLPRRQALHLLYGLQLRGPDLDELRTRDHLPLLSALVALLSSPRQGVRSTAATILARLLELAVRRTFSHFSFDPTPFITALRHTDRTSFDQGTQEYLERWLQKYAGG